MKRNLSQWYREAAEEFARRLTAVPGNQIDSIVLYGSVARGEARRDSDIDLLVISRNPEVDREAASLVRRDFEYKGGPVLITIVDFSPDEVKELVRLGSPFLQDVMEEGVTLHDNGAFAGICGKAVAVSR